MSALGRRVRAWLWRRRDHGYRMHGEIDWNAKPGRWSGDCRRCGGYEFDEPRHPRGMAGPDGWLR